MNTPRTLIIFWIQLNRWYNPDGPSVILDCHAGHQYSQTKNCRHSHNTFLYYSGNKLSLNHIKHIHVILWQAQKTCTPTNVVLSWITFVLTMRKYDVQWYTILSMKFCFALHLLTILALVAGLNSYAVLSQTALFIRSKRIQSICC